MKKLSEKLYNAFDTFMTEMEGGWFIFAIGIIAIILAAVGFYGTNGFDWKWFLFLHLPLYIFCAWALWQAAKMYSKTLEDINKRKK